MLGSMHRKTDKCVREDSDWETVAQHRKIARIYALFKAYSGEWAWKATHDKLRRP